MVSNTEAGLSASEQEVRDIVLAFFDSLANCDEETFLSLWHPNARRVGLGNNNELYNFSQDEILNYTVRGLKDFLVKNPEHHYEQNVDELFHIYVFQDLIASVGVAYHMIMPEGRGDHVSLIHLAKDEGKWLIVGQTDRGFEQ
ncbi:MAG: nuclear transport factor 2 family protein [Candidatus Heimdallarchaeota archaeon]